MSKSACPVCRVPVHDLSKRFDPVLGYLCVGCHGFLLYIEAPLRKVGIEGITLQPIRYTPSPEKP